MESGQRPIYEKVTLLDGSLTTTNSRSVLVSILVGEVAEDKGVPLRLELGPKDIQANSTLAVRRYDGKKWSIPIADIATAVSRLLEEIQNEMYSRALATQEERLVKVTNWDNLVPTLDAKNILVLPWCEEEQCEDDIKERSKSQYVLLSLSDENCE